MHIGVDFGGKRVGSTAICFAAGEELTVELSDIADSGEWVKTRVRALKADTVFIDAPLSLPAAYFHPETHTDFMFRQCDRETGAMSPMYLGAFTAQSMGLAYELREAGINVHETYPKYLLKTLGLKYTSYKKDLPLMHAMLPEVLKVSGMQFHGEIVKDHGFDSVLAWTSGWRHSKGESLVIGQKNEGLIVV